ncbi:MAG: hypothetical protein V4542_01665 [Pseudomonadota bacterium]
MTDELKQIEIATAKLKLQREQMALQDEMDKRARKQKIVEVAQGAMDSAKSIRPPRRGVVNWLVWVPGAAGLFFLFFGGPGDKSFGLLLVCFAGGIFLFRLFRR